jgi:hypothetical protein
VVLAVRLPVDFVPESPVHRGEEGETEQLVTLFELQDTFDELLCGMVLGEQEMLTEGGPVGVG